MAGINLLGTGQSLDLVPTIFSEFRELYDFQGVMRSCASEMRLKPHEGLSKRIVNYGRVVALSVADGVDIAQAQSLSDTATVYTPGEVGVQVVLAGSTIRRAPDPDLPGRTGRMMARALDLKEDGDGTLQLINFVPVVGAAARLLNPGMLLAATVINSIGNSQVNPEPAPPPWFFVHTPVAVGLIAGRLIPLSDVPTGTSAYAGNTTTGITLTHGGPNEMGIGQRIVKDGWMSMGQLFGTIVKPDANLALVGTDASGAVFSKEGLIYVNEVEPQLDPDTSDKSMRGAIELNLWNSYVWGLYRASQYGCEVLCDSTIPTG